MCKETGAVTWPELVQQGLDAEPPSEPRDVKALVLAVDASLRHEVVALLRPLCRQVLASERAGEASHLLGEQKPELLVLDMAGLGPRGLRLIRVAGRARACGGVIAIVGSRDVAEAVAAVKCGASQCLVKPLNAQRFLSAARRVIDEAVRRCPRGVEATGVARHFGGRTLVGQSSSMRDVWQKIEMVKDVSSSVLIQGETGTGKELVAYAIHCTSPRADGPFVKLNCGAIPKDLLESELFGHEKGAFTGALQRRIGRFEMADGGTMLLDEIGDMPLALQVKLLGVLQDRFVQRVGGHEGIPVDVRIIAATHQDLAKAIERKTFREDLYYRLNVITIRVPPLRQHKEDIPLLVAHLIKLCSKQTGRNVTGIDPDAMDALMDYDYPGNVRELENIIESAVVLCTGPHITRRELPPSVTKGRERGNEIIVRPGMPLSEVERLCITETLRYTGGNKQRAAELLGINPRSIYRKIGYYGINVDGLQEQGC